MGTFEQVIILFAIHFIGDFAFQSAWMAMEKPKSWEVLTYHVATYTAPFALLLLMPTSGATPLGIGVIFVTHFLEDAAKGQWQLVKSIWLDQLVHLAVLVILVLLGWM